MLKTQIQRVIHSSKNVSPFLFGREGLSEYSLFEKVTRSASLRYFLEGDRLEKIYVKRSLDRFRRLDDHMFQRFQNILDTNIC